MRKREARENKRRQTAETMGFACLRQAGHRDTETQRGRDSWNEGRRGDTPVGDGKCAKLLRTGEILAPRGAYDGGSRRLRENTLGCGRKKRGNGDTVSGTLVRDYRIRYYLSSDKLNPVN